MRDTMTTLAICVIFLVSMFNKSALASYKETKRISEVNGFSSGLPCPFFSSVTGAKANSFSPIAHAFTDKKAISRIELVRIATQVYGLNEMLVQHLLTATYGDKAQTLNLYMLNLPSSTFVHRGSVASKMTANGTKQFSQQLIAQLRSFSHNGKLTRTNWLAAIQLRLDQENSTENDAYVARLEFLLMSSVLANSKDYNDAWDIDTIVSFYRDGTLPKTFKKSTKQIDKFSLEKTIQSVKDEQLKTDGPVQAILKKRNLDYSRGSND